MHRKISLEHIISFSDTIFAFSITFMAVTIEIPNLPENLSEAQIMQNLIGELGPRFAIYVISYSSYHVIFILYALTLTFAGLLLTMVWLYARKKKVD
jgi:uncharacterized membrane protein